MKIIMQIEAGSFVRVRKDHPEPFRRGKDAQVYSDIGEQVGLTFGYDRYNEPQDVECVGIELWDKSELDLNTVY